MTLPEAQAIWMDGELVPWREAQVHVLTHGLHYGTGVLEGTRVYPTAAGPAAFRLDEHLRRLERSARMVRIHLTHDRDTLSRASLDLVRENGHQACYVRHLVYLGYGVMGLDTRRAPVRTTIATWEWGSYLGDEAPTHGIRLMTSSWRRNDPNVVPTAAKASGPYLNSVLAKREAVDAGFDEALLLSRDGYVAECSAENIFVVRDGVLHTPPSSAGALEGITAGSVCVLARDLGMRLEVRNLLRSDIYGADEVFVCGTAAGVVPVQSLDHREIGAPGPVAKQLGDLFRAITVGEEPRYQHWLTPVG
ncbi:branched-chain amino acid transaminase [Streptomyces netropsis]|uniref:Branched-chain-amino-acid aminotransferase n=1 Tax=Streptomyces netropsis TaxID=55404 RepID=A0A7W7L8D2_STRNE|nr:branched-chain amino acid transaminase [Streptomyces netropsis]MBB4885462.1 branched-chain amino acid aminotransferase [Streptomyces netropsis]GGR38340.1 branched chain amino acid aminotransferase [Streptomyces netropsis]